MKKKLIRKDEVLMLLQSISGCDATEEWSKGFDAAIDEAYKAVENMRAVNAIDLGSYEPKRFSLYISREEPVETRDITTPDGRKVTVPVGGVRPAKRNWQLVATSDDYNAVKMLAFEERGYYRLCADNKAIEEFQTYGIRIAEVVI